MTEEFESRIKDMEQAAWGKWIGKQREAWDAERVPEWEAFELEQSRRVSEFYAKQDALWDKRLEEPTSEWEENAPERHACFIATLREEYTGFHKDPETL